MSSFYNLFPSAHQRIPVWFLRQVGRYMPQYQKLKQSRSLYEVFHHTDSIVEATLLGPELLGVDAAILFADILSILDGFNIPYTFSPQPQIHFDPHATLLQFTKDPDTIFKPQLSAIKQLAHILSVPLIVFAASPFTLASYLIEGGSSKNLSKTMRFLYQYPQQFSRMLDTLTLATASYLQAQLSAGGAAVQLFESSSLRLPSALFEEYITKPNRTLISLLKQTTNIPVCLFCRCFENEFQTLYTIQADTLHPDYHINLAKLHAAHPYPSLQGNLDPAILLLPEQQLLNYCKHFLHAIQHLPNYIFNLGHGILPETPLHNVQALVSWLTSNS